MKDTRRVPLKEVLLLKQSSFTQESGALVARELGLSAILIDDLDNLDSRTLDEIQAMIDRARKDL